MIRLWKPEEIAKECIFKDCHYGMDNISKNANMRFYEKKELMNLIDRIVNQKGFNCSIADLITYLRIEK